MDYPSNVTVKKPIIPQLSTKDLSRIAVMTALIVGLNYLMLPLVNIKLMDLLVFVTGYTMGSLSGVLVGCLVWLVYGTLNPYGFSLPILVATCLGESIYGFVGGLCAASRFKVPRNISVDNEEFWASNVKLGVIGFLLTFLYDLFTNVVSGLTVGIPITTALIMGIPFMIPHQVSNFVFFTLGGTVLINAIRKFTVKEVT